MLAITVDLQRQFKHTQIPIAMKKTLLSLIAIFLITGLCIVSVHAQDTNKTKVLIKVIKDGKTNIDTVLFFDKDVSEEVIDKKIDDIVGDETLTQSMHLDAVRKIKPDTDKETKYVMIEKAGEKEDTPCLHPSLDHGIMIFSDEEKPEHVIIHKGEGNDSIITYTIKTEEGETTWEGKQGQEEETVYVTTTVKGGEKGEKTVVVKTTKPGSDNQVKTGKNIECEVNVTEGEQGIEKRIIIQKKGENEEEDIEKEVHVVSPGNELHKGVRVVSIDEGKDNEEKKDVTVIVVGENGEKQVITGKEMTVTTDEAGKQVTIVIKQSKKEDKTNDAKKEEVKKNRKK
jgi:hypothetical protein